MALPSIMRAIRLSEFGGPEILKVATEVVLPKPGPSEVLIKMKAAGVNPVDTYIRSGVYPKLPTLPYIPGKDGAGIVQSVGDSVTKLKEGDRVYLSMGSTGTYAEFAVADETHTHKLHSSVSFQAGAALGIPYFTSYRALIHRCHAKAGEKVLIHGASGAVGLSCVQMARALGMTVMGTAGSEAGMQLVKENGACFAFNHGKDGYIDEIKAATGGTGVDVIIEMLSNVNLENDLKLMALHGRIGVVGSRGSIEITPRLAMTVESSIIAVQLFCATKAELTETSNFLLAGQETGWLKPQVGKEYSLDNAKSAHEDVISQSGSSKGKLVINVNSD